jgi:hypothetical protein
VKTKITIIILEISDMPQSNGVIPLKVLVDESNNFIGKYISTKSEIDTISEILTKYSSLDIRYCYPSLTDFFHEESSSECEVVYTVKIPQGLVSPTNYSKLIDIDLLKIEEKYVRSIEQTPRSV